MKEIVINMLVLLIIPITLALIGGVCQFIRKKIEVEKAKAEKENNEAKLKALNIAEMTINSVVAATVGKIEQTTAADLRKAVKAGLAGREELKILSKDAYYEILDILQKDVLEQIEIGVQDYEKYIINKIENQVLTVKQISDIGSTRQSDTENNSDVQRADDESRVSV